MLSSILDFLGGVGNFASYISDFFKENGIRDRQEEYDSLLAKYNNLLDTIKSKEDECESRIEALKIEYEAEIQSMIDNIDSETEIDSTPRRIVG